MEPRAAYQIDGRQVAAEDFYAVACDPSRSVAVEACAGAGKTWMLVSRIIRALLDGCPAQDILAITFTKKAAGEMRDRLNAELRRCAGLGENDLIEALQARGVAPEEARRRAGDLRTLYQRVNDLGRPVQVRTFHSWFAALLRSAPLSVLEELQLPAQYELLEDDARAIALVWPHFYSALMAAPEVRQDFMESVALHGRHQTLKALENALQKRVEFALADAGGVVDRSVQAFGEAFPAFAGWEAPDQFFRFPDETRLAPFRAAARALGGAKAATFSAKGAELEQALTGRDFGAALAALLTQKDEPRKFGEKIVGIEAVREAQARAVELLAASRQHEAWQHQRRMARLTRVLLRSYAALKRERGWVDMNDVEGAALRLLGDAELSGWMQQRLDARVRHLLIDEFQDTNPLQWQALYGWLSGYAGAGAGDAPGVFLVGDPKQSIYRFRRAEPQVFKAAQAFVVDGLSGALLSCDHTRRCAQGVVDVLNTAMQAAVVTGEYGNGFREHTTASQEAGAVVALPQLPRSLRERDGGDDGEDLEWRDSLSKPRVLPEDTMSALEARQAADWVAAEVSSGRLQAEDIMVLSRRRERLAWMHDALLERGIASEQPEKLDLCEAPVVQDVVALLDVLVSSRHDLSLARALKSPLFGWSDEALAQLARLRLHWTVRADDPAAPVVRPCWWEVLRRWSALSSDEQDVLLQRAGESSGVLEPLRAHWTDATRRLALYRDWVHRLPPHDALSAIYEHGDVLARFAQAVPVSQRGAAMAQLRDLLAQSLAQEGGRFLTTYRLVRALKAGGIPATPTHTPGAVRLLTIHGAKGLEAHTVLMLDADSAASRPESMGVLVDWPGEAAAPNRFVFLSSEKTPPACAAGVLALEQQARALEELNALYVALTRAERRLVISSHEPHARGAGTSWYQRLKALAVPVEVPPAADLAAATLNDDVFSLPCLPELVREDAPVSKGQRIAVPVQDAPEDDLPERLGLALHRLLQWHPTTAERFDWHEAHTRSLAREFALDPDQTQHVLNMARRMISGDAAWVWDPAHIDHWGNEVELFHQGELLRLDRLVRRRAAGGEEAIWWLLDFKSAERPERQPELLAQMRRYRDAVSAARPGAPLRLAFINPLGQLIELAADQLGN